MSSPIPFAALPRDQLTGRVAGALKLRPDAANVEVDELAAAGLLEASGDGVQVTDAGRELQGRIRSTVGQVTQRLWGDLPEADVAAAARVLHTVLGRANAEPGSAVR